MNFILTLLISVSALTQHSYSGEYVVDGSGAQKNYYFRIDGAVAKKLYLDLPVRSLVNKCEGDDRFRIKETKELTCLKNNDSYECVVGYRVNARVFFNSFKC